MILVKRMPEYAIYKLAKIIDHDVARLDPLGLNSFFSDGFSRMSESGETDKLEKRIVARLNRVGHENILSFDPSEAMAATRDLGMFAGAFVRWKLLVSSVPVLEHLLEGLASITHEVPADTVFSYGPRNPSGSIRRRFTNLLGEEILIDSLVQGM